MKRRIIVILFVLLFNYILIEGVFYANNYMDKHNFLIKLTNSNDIDNNDNSLEEEEIIEPSLDDGKFNGENAEVIGKKIERYLKKTYLEGYGNYISLSSIKKGVNPYLVSAIILENTNCTIECSILLTNCNNVGDIKGQPGCFGGSYKKYDSVNDSIDDLIDYIYDKFVSNKLLTPNSIYKKYGKDVTWAFKVGKHMDNLMKK